MNNANEMLTTAMTVIYNENKDKIDSIANLISNASQQGLTSIATPFQLELPVIKYLIYKGYYVTSTTIVWCEE